MTEEVKDAAWSFYSCMHGHSNDPCLKCHMVPGHIEETQAPDGSVVRTYVEGVIPEPMPENWHEDYVPGPGMLTDSVTFRKA